jgi:hypothetical protein
LIHFLQHLEQRADDRVMLLHPPPRASLLAAAAELPDPAASLVFELWARFVARLWYFILYVSVSGPAISGAGD